MFDVCRKAVQKGTKSSDSILVISTSFLSHPPTPPPPTPAPSTRPPPFLSHVAVSVLKMFEKNVFYSVMIGHDLDVFDFASVCVCFSFLYFLFLPSMDHWLQSSMIVLSSCPLFNGPFWRSVTIKKRVCFPYHRLYAPCALFNFIEMFKPCTFQHVLEPLEFACWFSREFGLRAALALLTFSLFDFPFPAHPFPQMACWKSRNSLA